MKKFERHPQCEDCPIVQTCTVPLGRLATIHAFEDCHDELVSVYVDRLEQLTGVPVDIKGSPTIDGLQEAIRGITGALNRVEESGGGDR